MKLDRRRVDAYLRGPDPEPPVALLHGPDAGLVAERAERLGRSVVDDLRDPFRVSELTGDQLREDPRRLVEEAQALCLMGGRRLVRVRLATDSARAALELLLEVGRPEAFVVIEADELPAASKLRQLAEKAPGVAAIPCWRDQPRELEGTLREMLAELDLKVAPEAFQHLRSSLGGDRGVTRRELEKLALLALDRPGPVTLADARAAIGDSAAVAVDDAVYAALEGDATGLDRALHRSLAEGAAPVALLRALSRTVLLLWRLRVGMAEGGGTAEAAVRAAGPRIHFSVQDRLAAALRRHPPALLAAWLERLQAVEVRCKTARSPDELLCRRAFLDVAAEAGPGRQPSASPSPHGRARA